MRAGVRRTQGGVLTDRASRGWSHPHLLDRAESAVARAGHEARAPRVPSLQVCTVRTVHYPSGLCRVQSACSSVYPYIRVCWAVGLWFSGGGDLS
jgi:hypothetical protein